MLLTSTRHTIHALLQQVYRFITGEHSGDALRNILTTIIPSIFIFYSGHLDIAIAVGVGSLLASLTDLPGNRKDKWKSAKWCIPLFFIASLATTFVLTNPWLLLLVLIGSAFLCTLLSLFGSRVGVVGTMTLILVCFIIGMWPSKVFLFAVEITAGATWYYIISMILAYLYPHRSLRHALSDGFRSMSTLLHAKSKCYDDRIPLESTYTEIGRVHIQVSEQQEAIRLLLLQERNIRTTGKVKWLDQTYGLIDLYDLLMAQDHDYESVRQTLAPTHCLADIRALIALLAVEVDSLGAQYSKRPFSERSITNTSLAQAYINKLVDVRDQHQGDVRTILDSLLINIQSIIGLIQQIRSKYSQSDTAQNNVSEQQYRNFLTLPPKGWSAVKKQLTLRSTVFTFALRIAVLFGLGGSVGLLFPEYRYAYWILLTIAIVARPGFSTTQRRNFQRLIGTFVGIVVGLGLLYIVHDIATLLLIAAFGLYLFFLFNRPNYMVSVIFITIAIVLALKCYEGDLHDILGSRIIFTLIGSLLAVLGYFFVPLRQNRSMLQIADAVLQHNQKYYEIVQSQWNDQLLNIYSIRLARKQSQVVLASFSDAFHLLQKEPGYKKRDWSAVNTFHALAYRINSLIVGLSVNLRNDSHSHAKSQQLKERASDVSKLLKDLEKALQALR